MLTLRTITREPAATFAAMENRLNQLFNETLGWNGHQEDGVAQTWAPPVDIFEQADGIRIMAEIPGVKPEQVSISVEGNTLTMRGTKEQIAEERTERVHRYERAYGAFERSFTLPASVEVADIKATYDHGVLTVTLPKAEKAKPRQIAVEVAKS
jgi:HSP20 family protein